MIRAALRRVLEGSARNAALEVERARVSALRAEVRALTARAVEAEDDLEVRLDEVAHLDGRVAELEDTIQKLTDRDAVTWANFGFVAASRIDQLPTEGPRSGFAENLALRRERDTLAARCEILAGELEGYRGRLLPLLVSLDGVDLYTIDVDSMAGGADPDDQGDGLPASLTLRQTHHDGRPDRLGVYLRAPGEAMRLNWQADLEAVREVLDRLCVPFGPGPTAALDRLADDTEPAPSLVWRLAWLEGLVGALRSIPVPPATPRGAP